MTAVVERWRGATRSKQRSDDGFDDLHPFGGGDVEPVQAAPPVAAEQMERRPGAPGLNRLAGRTLLRTPTVG